MVFASWADLFNVHFDRNMATFGGAIYLQSHSTLNANDLSASQNRAFWGSVTQALGSCNISCENCFLSENVAERKNGAAIEIFNNSMIIVSDLRCLRQIGNYYSCIYAKFNCTVSVSNSAFTINTGSTIAVMRNSHLYTVNSKFVNNSTPRRGGAIFPHITV